MIVPGVIIIWTGTNASIPSGFVRETSLDGKYPKATAAGVDPNVAGGNATHSHTSPAHSHTLGAHTHTYVLTDVVSDTGTGATPGANAIQACEHNHTGTSGAISGGTTDSVAVTYGSVSNDPPYAEVIFIRSTGYNFVPVNASVLMATTIPTGFGFHDGVSATPDLRAKFLKGASTGANAGATGGSTTNTHDVSHGHTAQAHTHVAATSGAANSGCERQGGGTPQFGVDSSHTHTVALDSGTQAIPSITGSHVTLETVEPAYKKLLAIKNTSASPRLAKGVIALWMGLLSRIPTGWKLCDGTGTTPDMRGWYLKIATSGGEISTTGGSNTHTHAAQAHGHATGAAHTHATATISAHAGVRSTAGSGSNYDPSFRQHTLLSASSEAVAYANTNTTADSSSNQPLFTTVAYIQYEYSVGGGILARML
jgi:hypothetical protein